MAQERHILGVRAAKGWGADRIAALLGLPASTVHRVLRRHGRVGRRVERQPAVRVEYGSPGGLLHLDTKKLGRIAGGPGHRATERKARP